MILHPGSLLVILLTVGLVGVVLTNRDAPLSFATDIGYTDVQVCETIDKYGEAAVLRLLESGFPRPTSKPIESYRLISDGKQKALLQVDWQGRRAACMPPDHAGPVTVTLVLDHRAYNTFVGEVKSVIMTGAYSGDWYAGWIMWWGLDAYVDADPDASGAYKAALGRWAAGKIAGAG